MKKNKERFFTDAEICEIVEAAIAEYGLDRWDSGAGLCYYFHAKYPWLAVKEIVFFIKHYGVWRGRYVDCDGSLVADKSQFIYPMGQIEPRVRLMKKAVANYKKSLESKS